MFDVITIGTATRDVFLESDLFRVVHDPMHLKRLGFRTGEAQCFALGGKVEIGAPTLTVGGGAANAAVTFARQDLKTAAVIKIGRDENGAAVLRDMKKEKVSSVALYDKGAMTAYSVILLSNSGERTILDYRGASAKMEKSEIPFKRLKAKWAYIVPGKIPFSVISLIVAHLKSQGAKIAVNPSRHYIELGAKQLKPILSRLDVVIMNREEASYLTGVRYEEEHKIFRRLDELVDGIAVMTDGPKGVMVSDGDRVFSAGIFREKKLVDRTGAGDAFGSGFVSGLMSRGFESGRRASTEAIKYAIRLASANATSVVEAVGAQPGILRKNQFKRDARWKNFKISTSRL